MREPAAQRAGRVFEHVIDTAIDWIEDAWGFAWGLIRKERSAASRSDRYIKLPRHSVLITSADVVSDDPDVARRSFLLQSDRLCPLPIAEVAWGVARGQAGDWRIALARIAELERLRLSKRNIAGFFITDQDGTNIIIRDAPERRWRRRYWLSAAGAGLAFVLSLLFALHAVSQRADRQVAAMGQAESVLTQEILLTQRLAERLASNRANQTGMADTMAVISRIAVLRPESWQVQSFSVSNSQIRIEFWTENAGATLEDLQASLAEAGLESVTVVPIASERGPAVLVEARVVP